jgi:prepilin-type processing-associated H-X9-DG protein
MTDRMHQQLLGHLLGALDDAEEEQVEARLEQDEKWRREWVRWRRRLAPLEALRPDFEPPAGLAARTCRFVAACKPSPTDALAPRRRMSPVFAPPSRIAHVGWHDVAVVALLLVTTGAVLFPAIHGSRFHARLATCQDGLRQFGAALTQYSHHHGDAVSRLARNGQLTAAGVRVADRFKDGLLTDRVQAVFPEAWLAAQGAAWRALPVGMQIQHPSSPRTAVAKISARQSPGPQFFGPQSWAADNGPGMWHVGTTDQRRLTPSLTDAALLADAPGADLPGRALESHGGRGRNVLFQDGHIDFLPCAASRDLADLALSGDDGFSDSGISAPIVFINGR